MSLCSEGHHGPRVSASNRNEYQKYSLEGVKAADVYGWQHIHMLIVLKSGSLNLLEPSGGMYRDCCMYVLKNWSPIFFTIQGKRPILITLTVIYIKPQETSHTNQHFNSIQKSSLTQLRQSISLAACQRIQFFKLLLPVTQHTRSTYLKSVIFCFHSQVCKFSKFHWNQNCPGWKQHFSVAVYDMEWPTNKRDRITITRGKLKKLRKKHDSVSLWKPWISYDITQDWIHGSLAGGRMCSIHTPARLLI